MCSFNAISHKKYPPNNFFFFDTIVQNIFKNTITVYNLQMYLDWLAVVNSGLITLIFINLVLISSGKTKFSMASCKAYFADIVKTLSLCIYSSG